MFLRKTVVTFTEYSMKNHAFLHENAVMCTVRITQEKYMELG